MAATAQLTINADDAIVGQPYNYQLEANGDSPSWTLTKGKLPEGLSISSSGLISGTPKTKGKYTAKLTVNIGENTEIQKVNMNVYEPPSITNEKLKDAVYAKYYSNALKFTGTTPIQCELSGDLPDGITFNNKSLSGKTTQLGEYKLTLTLSNIAGTTSRDFVLIVSADPLVIKTDKLKDAKWNKKYEMQFKVSNKKVPVTFILSGDLPAGLSFDAENAKIYGTPSEVATKTFTLTASSDIGSPQKVFTLTVKGVNPKFVTKKLPEGITDTNYSADIEVAGSPEIILSASGLPAGLILSGDNISGTPTKGGKYYVVFTAANTVKTVNKKILINIKEKPEIKNSSLGSVTEGSKYVYIFTTTGTTPIRFSVVNGSLPSGLNLSSSTGKISGKPKVSGTFNFTIQAKNDAGIDSKDCTLVVIANSSTNTNSSTPEMIYYQSDTLTDNYSKTFDVYEQEYKQEYETSSGIIIDENCIIAAVLDEITVDESGLYEFTVDIDEDIEAGMKLIYFAGSEKYSSDDEIAEFYDIDGEEIENVPENHKIILSMWLNEGIKYNPVIYVK